MTTPDVLRKLIRDCADDGRTLRHEAKFVYGTRAEALARLAGVREQFVIDLERFAKCEPPHHGAWSELSREAAHEVCVAAVGRNIGDAIASCRHSRGEGEGRAAPRRDK